MPACGIAVKTITKGMSIRISKTDILSVGLMFVLISHAVIVFDNFYFVDLCFSLLRYMCFAAVALFYIASHPRITKFELLWTAFGALILFTTILGNGQLTGVIGPIIDIGLAMMIFHLYKNDLTPLLCAATIVFSFYIYLNLLLVLIYPDGIWTDPLSGNGYYLLSGNYNGMGARCICALITSMLYNKCTDNKLFRVNGILLYIASVFTVAYVGSATSTIGLLLLAILWGIAQTRKHRQTVITFFLFYVLSQTLIVFLLTDFSSSELIVRIIEDILNKDLTFTRRALLWENSSQLISESPWVGYGLQNKVWNDLHMDGPGSHNFIYTILLYGGYPLLLLFGSILIHTIWQTRLANNSTRSALLLGINILFFMMIFEYYTFFLIAYLIILLYYYPSIKTLQTT